MTVVRQTRRTALSIASALLLVGASATQARGQMPQASESKRFDTGIVIGGDWLQANALPLDRQAMQSVSFDASLRRQNWDVSAGFIRIARTLSTVQGGYVSGGPMLHWKQVLFLPTVGVMGGKSYASADSTGYNYAAAGGGIGHVPQYAYSTASTFGGSVGLAIEVPLYRMIGARAVASQWYFSGDPLEGDRARTVLGAGLSVRFGR